MKPGRMTDMSESVMKQIKSGKVHMRPRIYFMLVSIASILAAVAAGFVVSYIISIVFIWLRIQSAPGMARGARLNLLELIVNFPWWLTILAGALVGVTYWLVRVHGHLYKIRTLTLTLSIIAASLAVGAVMSIFDIGNNHTPGERNQSQGARIWRNTLR